MIPPDQNAAFVAAMEDVLEVYHRPHDPRRPLVCLDETSKQLIRETRMPIAMRPGDVARHDYEYERNGTANIFMLLAPLEGWRHVAVTDRRAALDYAQVLKDLVAGSRQSAVGEEREAAAATQAERMLAERPGQPLPQALIQTDALAKLRLEQENLIRELEADQAEAQSIKGQRMT